MRKISKTTVLTNTQGIFQSIGYKEFDEYLDAQEDPSLTPAAVEEARQEGLEAMKSATRRYARRQIHWVKTHFLSLNDRPRSEASLYAFDATGSSLFLFFFFFSFLVRAHGELVGRFNTVERKRLGSRF